MKRTLKFIFVIILPLTVFLVTAFSFSKKEKTFVKIDLLRMKVMFYEVDNPISVSATGIDPKNIFISVKGGTIRKDSINPARYIVRPNKEFGYIVLNVNAKSGNSMKAISADSFWIKKIENPVTYFSNIHDDGFLSREQIHRELGLFSRMINCDFDMAFKIESFSMLIYHDGTWKETKNEGPAFTKEMLADLSRVETNDKIIFHNVIVKGWNGLGGPATRKIPGLFITVN